MVQSLKQVGCSSARKLRRTAGLAFEGKEQGKLFYFSTAPPVSPLGSCVTDSWDRARNSRGKFINLCSSSFLWKVKKKKLKNGPVLNCKFAIKLLPSFLSINTFNIIFWTTFAVFFLDRGDVEKKDFGQKGYERGASSIRGKGRK